MWFRCELVCFHPLVIVLLGNMLSDASNLSIEHCGDDFACIIGIDDILTFHCNYSPVI